jgi:hypothetical protein
MLFLGPGDGDVSTLIPHPIAGGVRWQVSDTSCSTSRIFILSVLEFHRFIIEGEISGADGKVPESTKLRK